jgi:hypothetical protein
MKITSHFKHNVFMLDEAGELLEHLGGTEDYLLAAELCMPLCVNPATQEQDITLKPEQSRFIEALPIARRPAPTQLKKFRMTATA